VRRVRPEEPRVLPRATWVPIALAGCLLGGCLTQQMGNDLERAMDRLEGRPTPEPKPAGSPAFANAIGLPQRIWYGDVAAQIFHERRTNTFIAWDPVNRCWLGIPNDEAFARFKAERARLLPQGPPPDVNRALDRLIYIDPDWRGAR
jgi:hypothetical protein